MIRVGTELGGDSAAVNYIILHGDLGNSGNITLNVLPDGTVNRNLFQLGALV